jgi:glycosyltransferase involved in cell wall biosynthesis
MHRFAVLIAARNEEAVISQLIESIQHQSYPSQLIKIFVAADNCTDNTAAAAREAGAVVWERFNRKKIGKGYALNFLLKQIEKTCPDKPFDGYFVFDADNLLDENYISEMNKTFLKDIALLQAIGIPRTMAAIGFQQDMHCGFYGNPNI